MTEVPVVFYHYDASPFANKIKHMLLVKGIPHKRVTVAMQLPRPEITDLLGVTYRRIPILAIGNDVYCDTNLIASALERRFPASAGYRSLYPPRAGGGKADAALTKLLVRYWADAPLFRLGADSLPYGKFDAKFIADREQFSGGKIDAKALAAKQGYRNSAISSHLTLVEEQLADGRQWLLDTESIGALDVTAHLFLSWIRGFRHLKDIFSAEAFPKTLEWLDRVSKHLSDREKSNVAAVEKLSGEDAAKLIASSPHEAEALVGFAAAEGARLGVKVGDIVSVVPVDSARVPTVGRLLALSREESVVEVKGQAGIVRCHFPRLEFVVKLAQTSAKL